MGIIISNVAFGGTAYDSDDDHYIDSAQVTLNGDLGFNYNSNHYVLSFYLKGTFAPQTGIFFDDGSPAILFTAGPNSSNLSNQPTAGIVADRFPGLWAGQTGSSGYGKGVGTFDNVLGLTGVFFLDGYITAHANDQSEWMTFGQPALVPVPAAAWLFDSGLAGLVVTTRRRRA